MISTCPEESYSTYIELRVRRAVRTIFVDVVAQKDGEAASAVLAHLRDIDSLYFLKKLFFMYLSKFVTMSDFFV